MLKNKIRKINIAVLAVMFFIGMTGCGNSKGENKKEENFKEITVNQESEKNIVKKMELPENSFGTITNGIYTATQGALQMAVPDTWNVSKEDAAILVAGKEEETKDCVIIHVAEKDDKFKEYKQKDFEEAYNQMFDNLEFEEFKQTKIGNLEAIYMKYTCSKDSMDIVEYQYMLNGENTYLISFTDVSGKLGKEIDKCMDSIVICK